MSKNAHTNITPAVNTYTYRMLGKLCHHSDEPNAITFTQVLALSHTAQVLT